MIFLDSAACNCFYRKWVSGRTETTSQSGKLRISNILIYNQRSGCYASLASYRRNKYKKPVSEQRSPESSINCCVALQVYFQRVLSCQSPSHARMLSYTASVGCLLSAVPACIIGAIAKATGNAFFPSYSLYTSVALIHLLENASDISELYFEKSICGWGFVVTLLSQCLEGSKKLSRGYRVRGSSRYYCCF